jgi:hypothetical protein
VYKLTVVAGPNRGTSYAIRDGENGIGRQSGNVVVLSSSKVSKRHCVLVVDNERVLLRDENSANGTFVNGELAKRKELHPGDRISVGEYVFELRQPRARGQAPGVGGALQRLQPDGNVIQFPVAHSGSVGGAVSDPAASWGGIDAATRGPQGPPKDLLGKVTWFFENQVMPAFYQLNLKYEWKMIAVALFGAFLVANLAVSVYPVVNASRKAAIREIARRASFMGREIADRNAKYLSQNAESKVELGIAENAYGVRVVVLTDLDQRVIAPANRLNEYLTTGREAVIAKKASDKFKAGGESGVLSADNELVVAVEPVKIFDSQRARNVVVAMVVVSIDATLLSSDIGEIGLTFAETLILTGILGGILLLILYRLTLRPFQVLSDDMDKVLKGELSEVTREYQLPELNGLWDLINSALSRANSKSGPGASGEAGGSAAIGLSAVSNFAQLVAAGNTSSGVVVCDADKRVLYMNGKFEDISGIRLDSAQGQDFSAVARDQSLGAFVADLLDRASAALGGEMPSEEYSFSGVAYRVSATAFEGSRLGSGTQCFLLVATPTGGDG